MLVWLRECVVPSVSVECVEISEGECVSELKGLGEFVSALGVYSRVV